MVRKRETYSLFRCPLCKGEDSFAKSEMRNGDPMTVDDNCDHCGTQLVYVGEITGDHEVQTVPPVWPLPWLE